MPDTYVSVQPFLRPQHVWTAKKRSRFKPIHPAETHSFSHLVLSVLLQTADKHKRHLHMLQIPYVLSRSIHINQAWAASGCLNVVLVIARASSSSVKGLPYAEPLAWPIVSPFVTVCTSCSGSNVALSPVFGRRFSSRVCCLERPTTAC